MCQLVATATQRIYSGPAMAVVIASNLRKELAGSVLFDGVSFSVERRDQLALSGPNGAGIACASIYLPSKTLAGLDHPASPVA